MELKSFQRRVLEDLTFFLNNLQIESPELAFKKLWLERYGVDLEKETFKSFRYKSQKGIPLSACIKIPTGGGKTFVGVNATKLILDKLPSDGINAVVWLVPSDTILKQTLEAFRNPLHPYRIKLSQLFGSVNVLSKEQLLQGVGFNRSTVTEALTLMVLSYDSFRGKKNELKSKRENSQLLDMSMMPSSKETKVEDADPTSLLQVINKLNPVVVVDESHHAKTSLSMDMLRAFNPRFVLELTATPKQGSNIIACANAVELKREHLIKLPVILYNLPDQTELLSTAISLRSRLEELAVKHGNPNQPIRPIVLVQAQPKKDEDAVNFEKVKKLLIQCGIKPEEIAIKTATINEIENQKLGSLSCPIRYIITVNALKEGWDCPCAYILASLANKTSKIDVEQILGRVLRQPYATQHSSPALNLAYVLTSSSDFNETVKGVIDGLKNAGFSERDYLAKNKNDQIANQTQPEPEQKSFDFKESENEKSEEDGTTSTTSSEKEGSDNKEISDFVAVDTNTVKENTNKANNTAEEAIEKATEAGASANKYLKDNKTTPPAVPQEVVDKMKIFHVRKKFQSDIEDLKLPIFGIEEESIFSDEEVVPMELSVLNEGFHLPLLDATLSWSENDSNVVKIDTNTEGKIESQSIQERELDRLSKLLATEDSVEKRRARAKQYIIGLCDSRLNFVSNKDLASYLDKVLEGVNQWQLQQLTESTSNFANAVISKIQSLHTEHCQKKFKELHQKRLLHPCFSYELPKQYYGEDDWIDYIGKSLYDAEEPGNSLELEFMNLISGIPNVLWWHRNPAKTGFYINGPTGKHFPDFIIKTKSQKTILIETKGEQLRGNDDTSYKIKIGKIWEEVAGRDHFSYFMVFKAGSDADSSDTEGAVSLYQIADILKAI